MISLHPITHSYSGSGIRKKRFSVLQSGPSAERETSLKFSQPPAYQGHRPRVVAASTTDLAMRRGGGPLVSVAQGFPDCPAWCASGSILGRVGRPVMYYPGIARPARGGFSQAASFRPYTLTIEKVRPRKIFVFSNFSFELLDMI
jgi:hypothetical protein